MASNWKCSFVFSIGYLLFRCFIHLHNLKLSCHAGPYKLDELIAGFADLHQQYGDVVRLKLGQETVLIFNPDDIRLLFQHEGKYPKRPTFEALKKYRKEKHGCVGIVPE